MVKKNETISLRFKPVRSGDLERSGKLLERTVEKLRTKDPGYLTEITNFDYRQDFQATMSQHPKQSVVILRFIQPTTLAPALRGFFHENTQIAVTHISP